MDEAGTKLIVIFRISGSFAIQEIRHLRVHVTAEIPVYMASLSYHSLERNFTKSETLH